LQNNVDKVLTMTNEPNVIAESFKGYSTFIEVENVLLRAYNQYMTLRNLVENKLFQLSEDYYLNLSTGDRLRLLVIKESFAIKGEAETKRQLIREGVFLG
jgi:hypothetical protein